MANVVYENFYLSNEIEDQFNSHLDLQQFCTVDDSLTGEPGMLRKVNCTRPRTARKKLALGQGNTKVIEVGFTPQGIPDSDGAEPLPVLRRGGHDGPHAGARRYPAHGHGHVQHRQRRRVRGVPKGSADGFRPCAEL